MYGLHLLTHPTQPKPLPQTSLTPQSAKVTSSDGFDYGFNYAVTLHIFSVVLFFRPLALALALALGLFLISYLES